jgi:hypothetical protein
MTKQPATNRLQEFDSRRTSAQQEWKTVFSSQTNVANQQDKMIAEDEFWHACIQKVGSDHFFFLGPLKDSDIADILKTVKLNPDSGRNMKLRNKTYNTPSWNVVLTLKKWLNSTSLSPLFTETLCHESFRKYIVAIQEYMVTMTLEELNVWEESLQRLFRMVFDGLGMTDLSEIPWWTTSDIVCTWVMMDAFEDHSHCLDRAKMAQTSLRVFTQQTLYDASQSVSKDERKYLKLKETAAFEQEMKRQAEDDKAAREAAALLGHHQQHMEQKSSAAGTWSPVYPVLDRSAIPVAKERIYLGTNDHGFDTATAFAEWATKRHLVGHNKLFATVDVAYLFASAYGGIPRTKLKHLRTRTAESKFDQFLKLPELKTFVANMPSMNFLDLDRSVITVLANIDFKKHEKAVQLTNEAAAQRNRISIDKFKE